MAKKEWNVIKLLSMKYCGKYAKRYSKYLESLKQPIIEADLKILFKTYVAMIFFSIFIIYVSTFILTLYVSSSFTVV